MDKKLNKENLKIAIQKDGRLTEDSLRTLRSRCMAVDFLLHAAIIQLKSCFAATMIYLAI